MFFRHDVGFQCARVSAQKNTMKFRKSTVVMTLVLTLVTTIVTVAIVIVLLLVIVTLCATHYRRPFRWTPIRGPPFTRIIRMIQLCRSNVGRNDVGDRKGGMIIYIYIYTYIIIIIITIIGSSSSSSSIINIVGVVVVDVIVITSVSIIASMIIIIHIIIGIVASVDVIVIHTCIMTGRDCIVWKDTCIMILNRDALMGRP